MILNSGLPLRRDDHNKLGGISKFGLLIQKFSKPINSKPDYRIRISIFPEKKNPAVISPNFGGFFRLFSDNFRAFSGSFPRFFFADIRRL